MLGGFGPSHGAEAIGSLPMARHANQPFPRPRSLLPYTHESHRRYAPFTSRS
jgi:hypothetical protein